MSLLLLLSLPTMVAFALCVAGYTVHVLYPRIGGTR